MAYGQGVPCGKGRSHEFYMGRDASDICSSCRWSVFHYRRSKKDRSFIRNFEKLLSDISYPELVKFINSCKNSYEISMKPIVSKIEASNKKKNGKK